MQCKSKGLIITFIAFLYYPIYKTLYKIHKHGIYRMAAKSIIYKQVVLLHLIISIYRNNNICIAPWNYRIFYKYTSSGILKQKYLYILYNPYLI